MQTERRRPHPIGSILMIVGGIVTVIASFLPWATVDVLGLRATATGMDGDGVLTTIGGALLIAIGALTLRRGFRALAAIGLLVGVLVVAVGAYDASTVNDTDVGAQLSADVASIDVSVAYGLYLVIGAGALGAIGGAIRVATSGGRDERLPAEEPSPGEVATGPPRGPGERIPTAGWAGDLPPLPPPPDADAP
jgi:hypothetical protein